MGKIFSYRKIETEWLSLGKEAKASHLDVKVTNSGFLHRALGLEYYVRPLLNSCVDSALFSFRTNTQSIHGFCSSDSMQMDNSYKALFYSN